MSEGAGDVSGGATGVPPGALTALLEEVAATPETREVEPDAIPAGTVVGRFEIVRELGRGGFGVVYEARDRDLDRRVAVKIVRPGRIQEQEGRVSREAEAIARLSHPNLITLFEVGRSEHGPFLVFELLRGKTLDLRIEEGPLPVPEAVHVATEIARGLAHAHAEGVIHRDLKPSNVFVTTSGQVKILDFGMAHAFGRRRLSGGTPAYMAPEQWDDAPEDERTDVFALGVMLHRMLTGAYPFTEGKGRWAAEPGRAGRLDAPGAPELAGLVERMLDRRPTARPRDGAAVVAALAPVEVRLRATPAHGGPPARARRRKATLGDRLADLRRRSPRLLAIALVAGLLAVAAIGGGAWIAWRRGAGERSASAPPAASPSVAVLPFKDLSPNHDQEYFSEGVAEEILGALTRVRGLRVPGRSSSFWFKGKGLEPAEIARRLGVSHLLDGTVRRSGTKVRISAEVVTAASGERLWSQTYERDGADVFAIQDDIARSVVQALAPVLVARTPPPPSTRATDPEAYRLFLLGRSLNSQATAESLRRAVETLERSASIDPRYVPTQAFLAFAYANLSEFEKGDERERLRRVSRSAADRAVSLDPAAAAGYAPRALFRVRDELDWEGAAADLDRAIALDPSDPTVLNARALLLAYTGRTREAIEVQRSAVDRDPLSAIHTDNIAIFLLGDGQYAEAGTWARRALELSPGMPGASYVLGWTAFLSGDARSALTTFESLSEPRRSSGMAVALHALGRETESKDAADRLERDFQDRPVLIAGVRAWRGELDAAFEALDRAVRERAPGLQAVRASFLLRPLHGDPRFTTLLRSLGLPADGAAAPTARAGSPLPSVAVLPFADMSPRHDQEHFADGIAEEIRNALSHVAGIKVIGRTSSTAFKGKPDDLRTIGRKLGVASVLEGSVRKQGTRLRITTNLVRVDDGSQVWNQSFDRDQDRVFAVQEEVARAVTAALRVKLLPGEDLVERWVRTDEPGAYEQLLLGRRFMRQGTLDAFRRALAAFEKALALDPGYAPAWAGVANALISILAFDRDDPELRRRAMAAADRAVASAPDDPNSYLVRAWARRRLQFDWAGAVADLDRASRLRPGDTAIQALRAELRGTPEPVAEAIARARAGTDRDPLNPNAWVDLGLAHMAGEDFSGARQALARALEIAPGHSGATWNTCACLVAGGRAAEALELASRSPFEWLRLTCTALAQHDLGRSKESNAALAALVEGWADSSAIQVAQVHAWRGEADRAFEWMDRAFAQRDLGMLWIRTDPLFRKVHADPRWEPFLRKMSLPGD